VTVLESVKNRADVSIVIGVAMVALFFVIDDTRGGGGR
jgi:lipoprotein signal peptidase